MFDFFLYGSKCDEKNYSVLLISDSYFKELPTLLHCAAKFGLKNLAVHLLQCSGATRASKIKNLEGSDPAHIAERRGHKELKKIFEDFSVSCFFPFYLENCFYKISVFVHGHCSFDSDATIRLVCRVCWF